MPATAFDHTIIGACENLRKESIDLAGQNHPMMLERKNGALAFVTDAANGNVDVQVDQVGDGTKLTTLKILYDQPTRACQASTSLTTNICNDTTTTPTRKQFTKAIGKKISSPGRYFSNDDLVIICQGSPEYIKTRLQSDLRATKEAMNEVLLAELFAMRGKIYHWDGTETQATSSTGKQLQLLLTSSGQDLPQPGNFVQIAQDFDNMKLSGVPAVIGDGYFDRYMRLNNLACCNSNTPYAQNISNAGVAYYYDHKASDIFGANKTLVIPYGLVHLITFNKNANIVKLLGDNGNVGSEFHMVIPDPDGYPFSWNFDMKWDCTTERWKYMYSLHWDVFNIIQADSFGSDSGTPDCGDDNLGISGVFNYSITRG